MRYVMTRVFPLPAPARMSTGPSVVSTASRCCGLSWERKDKKGTRYFNFTGMDSSSRWRAHGGLPEVCLERVRLQPHRSGWDFESSELQLAALAHPFCKRIYGAAVSRARSRCGTE